MKHRENGFMRPPPGDEPVTKAEFAPWMRELMEADHKLHQRTSASRIRSIAREAQDDERQQLDALRRECVKNLKALRKLCEELGIDLRERVREAADG